MLFDDSKLSDRDKEFVSELESELSKTGMNSVAADMFIHNAVTFNRLLEVLEVRGQIRTHDRKYVKGILSASEWGDAENNYDPMKELLSIFGDTFSGKSDGKDK